MRYRFQLLISKGPADRYTIQAFTPRGQGRASFELPFQEENEVLWRAAQAQRDIRPACSLPEGSPKAVGERLFETLFQGEILRLYERSLDLLEADPETGLRLELTLDPRDPDLATLQALPWELLRQPGTPEFLALNPRLPVTRFLAVPRPVPAASRPHTLRILAVAANSNLRPLNLSQELRNLEEAVGSAAQVFMPEAPTLAALRQALRDRECHVLHFMGHGGSAAPQSEKVLFFEAEDGSPCPVRGTDLVNALAGFPSLRLVVLNACRSAMAPEKSAGGIEFDVFAGVAHSLVLGGIPAVIAMQLPITDAAAIQFSRAFYKQLAAGQPVDAAVAEGRQAVHSAKPGGMEWATPVLFMRTPTGELYPRKDLWDLSAGEKPGKELAYRLTAILLALVLAGGAGLAARNWRVERLVTEGAALSGHGQWAEARERFWAALKLAPGSAEVLSNLAGTEEKLGDVRAAEEHYREAVRQQPDSAEHLYNLGHFLNGRKSYDEAYRFLLEAVDRDPQKVDAFAELAQAAAGRGMLERAREFLGVALRLDPERPALHRRLGELELETGNPRAALPPLDEARRRYALGDLGRVETVWLLTLAYDRLGNVASACREIHEFRRLDGPGITPWAPKVEDIAARHRCPSR